MAAIFTPLFTDTGEPSNYEHKIGIKQGLNPCFTTSQPSKLQNKDAWTYRVATMTGLRNVYKARSTEPGGKGALNEW